MHEDSQLMERASTANARLSGTGETYNGSL